MSKLVQKERLVHKQNGHHHVINCKIGPSYQNHPYEQLRWGLMDELIFHKIKNKV